MLVTGGQVNTMAEWIAQFKSALAKRSLLWKVSIAQAHLDAVVGTASLSYALRDVTMTLTVNLHTDTIPH